MAFESVNYQCPACGGPLHFASAEQKLVCDYCDSRFEVEEVEALYRERQDKADAKADAAAATPKPVADDAVQELAQNAGYICSSCGAELVSDGTVAVTTCPYCGNSAVAPGQLSGDFSPDLVIPFKLGRDDVTAALKEHYKGKILLPKSFVTGNHIDEVQGVYVPFWLYGARVDGEVYFDATNETVTEESVHCRPRRSAEKGTLPQLHHRCFHHDGVADFSGYQPDCGHRVWLLLQRTIHMACPARSVQCRPVVPAGISVRADSFHDVRLLP